MSQWDKLHVDWSNYLFFFSITCERVFNKISALTFFTVRYFSKWGMSDPHHMSCPFSEFGLCSWVYQKPLYTYTCAAIIDKKPTTPSSIKSPSWHAECLLRYFSPSNKWWPFRISLLHSLMFVFLRVFYWREFPLRQCKSDIIYVLPSLEPILVKLICCI